MAAPARPSNHEGTRQLDEAYDELEKEVPSWLAKGLRWMRQPESRWIRLPIGILLILSSLLWFLPVVGIEFLPLGLVLVAQDIPFLRKPVARMIRWLLKKWRQVKEWWADRKARKARKEQQS